MAWIESHTTLRAHKKLKPLCDDLGIGRAQAIGHLHMLWWWAIEHRPYGDLANLFDSDIAAACDWHKDPKKLMKALRRHGWITPDNKIKDWLDYAGRLLRDRERKKLGRVRGHSTEQVTDDSELTEPNQTVPYRKDLKTGFLTDEEQKIIRQDIAKALNCAENSEAATQRLTEIVGEISKAKAVKNVLALARHKALKQ